MRLLAVLFMPALLWTYASATDCAFLDRNRPHEAYETVLRPGVETAGLDVLDQAGKGQIQADNVTIKCVDDNHYCYSLWTTNGNDTSPILLMQGCWDHADPEECGREACISNRSGTKFCCCRGDMCNVNVIDGYVPAPPAHYDVIRTKLKPPVDYVSDDSYRIRTVVVALTSVFAAALAITVVFLVYRLCIVRRKRHHPQYPASGTPLAVGTETTSPPPSYLSDDLSLNQCLSRGRYGQIWTANLNTDPVIVKILGQHQEKHFLNERDIYSLPFMDHSSILKFYGSETRSVENNRQYWLVLEYLPLGALAAFLKNNIIDWNTLCKMCHSTASGLAHLHADICKAGLVKPVIAHRDVTSRNILVRSDLSCCLADFGFSLALRGSRLDEREAEPNLTDVGTLRYMSPEVLDGAVNLRDCESSLKQIDVYALGLVMWEMATRCSDLYQGLRVPDHHLPFTAELGQSPTFDDMQLYVSRHKLRPSFPDIWKDSNQAIRTLKETIDECWDQDAEARLTAMCVQERCVEMAALWQVKYRNMLPLSHHQLADRAVVQRNACTSPPSSAAITASATSPGVTVTDPSPAPAPAADKNANVVMTSRPQTLGHHSATLPGYQRLRNGPYGYGLSGSHGYGPDYSERSTETVVSLLSPSLSDHNNLVQVQQTHGRNPMVERNTHKRSDEDMTVQGNAIVDSARPVHPTDKVTSIFLDSPPSESTDQERAALVATDDLNRRHWSQNQNQPPGIPYLQNRVDHTTPVMPAKRYNQQKTDTRYKLSLSQFRTALNWFRGKPKSRTIVTEIPAQKTSNANVQRGIVDAEKCNLNNPRATRVQLRNDNSVITTTANDITDCVDVTEVGLTRLQNERSVNSVNNVNDVRDVNENQSLLSQRPSSLSLDSNRSGLKSGNEIKYRIKTPACHETSLRREGRFSLYDDRMMDNTAVVRSPPRSAKTSISLQQFSSVTDPDHVADHMTERQC